MKVLIFGCGYLGSRAAQLWRGAGCEVFAVTRKPSHAETLRAMGLRPIVADITQPDSLAQLPAADTVLFAVGFDRSKYDDIEDVYVHGLNNVLQHLNEATRHLVYISSTGVFGDADGQWVDETTRPSPIRPGAVACLKAEQLIQASSFAAHSTVLRLAGIYGKDRVPKRKAIENRQWSLLSPDGHLNLIHVDDAAAISFQIVQQQIKNDMFVVSDGHPGLRREFYQFVADQLGAGPIDWSLDPADDVQVRSQADKKINNQKLIRRTAYRFLYPDYRSGIPASLGCESSHSVADAAREP
jgi:nucleoside-diphosphate-sugar epimerase